MSRQLNKSEEDVSQSNVICFKSAKEAIDLGYLMQHRNEMLMWLRDMEHPMAQKIVAGILLSYYDSLDQMREGDDQHDQMLMEASGAVLAQARLDQEDDVLGVRLYQSDVIHALKDVRDGRVKITDLTDFVRFDIRYSTTDEKKTYLEAADYPMVNGSIVRLQHEIFSFYQSQFSTEDNMSPVLMFPLAIAATIGHPMPGERPYKVLKTEFGDNIVINTSNGDFQMDITFNFNHVRSKNGWKQETQEEVQPGQVQG